MAQPTSRTTQHGPEGQPQHGRSETTSEAQRGASWRPSRRAVRPSAGLFGLAVVALGLIALALFSVKGDLRQGRTALEHGRAALSRGDLPEAQSSLHEAALAFDSAKEKTHGPLFRLAGLVPVLGRNTDVAVALSQAGSDLTDAATEITDAVEALPKGLGSLAPNGGSIPIDALAELQGPVSNAEARALQGLRVIQNAPTSLLLPPIGNARSLAEDKLSEAHHALLVTRMILTGLPDFAGADGPRRYFFGAENPAELRGTAGLMGAYAILTIRDGRVSFSPFRPIESLPTLPADSLPAPDPDYRRNYDQFGGAGYWRNMNMTPDFPTVARVVEAAYEKVTGTALDGVITADPFALKALLELTGPTKVPGLGVRVNADNVVAFTTNEAYTRFRRSRQRKRVLGAVAAGVLERFLGSDQSDLSHLRVLPNMIEQGNVKVFSNDPSMEQGLEQAGVAGGLPAPGGDVLSVIVNSGSKSKIDFWAHRTVSYSVRLGAEGSAVATTDVQIRNDAPTSGQPAFGIGGNVGGAPAGVQVPILTIYCAPGCQLASAERNGSKIGLQTGTELGLRWYRDYFSIPAGTTGHLHMTTALPRVWTGNSSGGSYRLSFLNQTTIHPTDVRIQVTAPGGTRITQTSVPMQVDGATATWQGMPPRNFEIEVSFSAPLPLRIWRDLTRPLT